MELSVPPQYVTLPPQSGAAFALEAGDVLLIDAPDGAQVADVALFLQADTRDCFSPGRTMDYNERVVPGLGDVLYSHRSTALATIVEDSTGVHDVLLTPCSEAMFSRRGQDHHPSCHGNLAEALRPYGLGPDDVTATLNAFMDVRIEGNRIVLHPPANAPEDRIAIRADAALIVGISACSSELTNGGRCKPVRYAIDRAHGARSEDLNRH